MNNPQYIVLHHTASPMTQTFETINAYHKKKFNFRSSLGYYAGYHYVIDAKGQVHQARAHKDPGAHTKEDDMNYKSLGVCLTGWFDDGHDAMPNEKQRAALKKLLTHLMQQENIPWGNIRFHRDYAPKSCPGMHITKNWIYQLIEVGPYEKTNQDIFNNMFKNEDELRKWLAGEGYVKKDIRLNVDLKNGKAVITGNGKQFEAAQEKAGDSPNVVQLKKIVKFILHKLSGEALSDVERNLPKTDDLNEVLKK